jgi:hypothetical protein
MTRNERIQKIGKIGEELVQNSLLKHHKIVTLSENKFDSVKNMIADGETIEVKTLVPIRIENAFCIGSDQITKCLNVNRFMIVEISRGDTITIREYKNPRNPYKKWFGGDNCYFFKLTNGRIYDTIEDRSIAAELRVLSPSNFL